MIAYLRNHFSISPTHTYGVPGGNFVAFDLSLNIQKPYTYSTGVRWPMCVTFSVALLGLCLDISWQPEGKTE